VQALESSGTEIIERRMQALTVIARAARSALPG